MIKDEIVQEQLLFCTDVKEGNFVVRRYVRIQDINRSLSSHDVFYLTLYNVGNEKYKNVTQSLTVFFLPFSREIVEESSPTNSYHLAGFFCSVV